MINHQLPHPQLIEFLRQHVASTPPGSTAVLVVSLPRTDRQAVITGAIPSQLIRHHIDQRFNAFLRKSDRFAHFDNDMVLLVLPSLANCEHSVLAALKIIAELKKPFMIDDMPVMVRPSIGIASFPETSLDANQLLMQADTALRTAATSEHGFYVYQPTGTYIPEANNTSLEDALGVAIHANELRVEYQPKVDLHTGRCIAAEALVRWTAPWGQEINPGNLISAAENAGLINPLTLWILNTALRHAASFEKAGVGINVSVNLPAKMLAEEELPLIVHQALEIWGVPPTSLTLEITESSMIENMEASISMLEQLRKLGLRLSIDDFGTGYSALAYLKRLPVQELKIDLLFVHSIHNSANDKQLVRSIIELAHNFGMITVAEGVEDQKTLDLLRELGCDIVQGFFYSRALPEADFIQWCRRLAGQ
jgi:predicted signal transduction protein with EAL and GGDEF domain